MSSEPQPKPELTILPGQQITGPMIDKLYEKLTGKKPTPEESQQGAELAEQMRQQRKEKDAE